jgi:hypothetical protein
MIPPNSRSNNSTPTPGEDKTLPISSPNSEKLQSPIHSKVSSSLAIKPPPN